MTAVAFAPRPKELFHMITVRKAWLGIGQSSIYLKPNQHITVGQLVPGLLMVSGNDAATRSPTCAAGRCRRSSAG